MTEGTMYVPVENVLVNPDRIREEYSDEQFEALCISIEMAGQLQPIVVEKNGSVNTNPLNENYNLVFGEHRLKAITKLHTEKRAVPGLSTGLIRVELKDALSYETRLMLEYEEQVQRKDFTFGEKAKYVRKLHAIFCSRTSKWTETMTAAALKISGNTVNYLLRLEQATQEHPEVAKATTTRSAIKRMKTIEQLAKKKREVEFKLKQGDEGPRRAKDALTHADAREWIKQFESSSVDLINFDPPWGDEVSRKSADNWESFDDSTETADKVMNDLFPELFRILKPDSFCIFWYRQWYYKEALELALNFGFDSRFTRTPCIWYKPDKVSDENRYPEKQLIDAYETFFLLRKGDPVFNDKEVQNVFVEPRVPRAVQIHPTEKPVSLCTRLIKLTTVPGASAVDPCAGSSAFLEAAYRAHRQPRGCELVNTFYDKGIIRLSEVMK